MIRKLFLLLSLYASISGCKKSTTDIPDDSSFFGRFNGFAASITTANPPGLGKATTQAQNTPISSNQSNGSYTSILGGRDFGVSFTKSTLIFAGNGAPSSSEFFGFFSTGAVLYITPANFNGIAIGYVDKSGTQWNSFSGDQTGSVFTITNSQQSGNNVKIQAEFTCTLYDGNGHSLALTGGMFTGQFSPQ
jgi:hypothetical protein